MFYRDSYKAKRVKFEKCSSFEHQAVSLSCGSSRIFTQDFLPQFHLIIGDFNFHVNIDTDVDARKLKSLLHQHMNIPTNIAGNALALVISRGDIWVKDLSVRSDHFAVLFPLSSSFPGLPRQAVMYLCWRSVDHDQLRKDISDAFSYFTCSDVESAVHDYNEVLQNIVDKHAPEKTCVVTIRPEAPWYNSKLAKKRLKRKYGTDLPLIGNFTIASGINIKTCWIQPNMTTLKLKWRQQLPPKNFSKFVINYCTGQMTISCHIIAVGLN